MVLRPPPRSADHIRTQLASQTYAFFKGDFAEVSRLGQHVLDAGDASLSPYAWTNIGWVAFSASDVDAAIGCQERNYEHLERSGRLFDHACGAFALAVTLAIAGRDAGTLPRQIIERATAIGWRSGIALGWYTEAVATEASDPERGLDAYNRAFEIASEVGCQTMAMTARRDRLNLQAKLLSPAQLVDELTSLLRYVQQVGDTFAAINALSRTAEVLHASGVADGAETAAMICGWLDGRTNRTVAAAQEFDDGMAAVRAKLGDRWQRLVDTGRSMSTEEIIDLTCGELAGIT